MSPNNAWASTFTMDVSKLTPNQAVSRIFVMDQIKRSTTIRGRKDADRRLRNRKKTETFSEGTIVLVRVPLKFRATKQLVWGRKAELIRREVILLVEE